jgi:large subunit ribosomal protein L10
VLKTDKERIVTELAADLNAAETLIVADYRGLTNKQLESLRDELLKHGARFRIVKNTLTRRAAEQAGAEALLVMLEGPTAIAFIESTGDPAAVAKALATTAKATNVLTLRGGILEGKALSGDEVDRLATLPPFDVLRAQLVGAIVAPLMQLLALVSAPLRDLHGLIDARIKQLEEQGQVVELTAEVAIEEQDSAAAEVEQAAEAEHAAEVLEAEETSGEAATDTPSDSASAGSDDQEGPAVPATAESPSHEVAETEEKEEEE